MKTFQYQFLFLPMGRGIEVSKLILLDECQEQLVSEKLLNSRDFPNISLHHFEEPWLVILDVSSELTLDELIAATSIKVGEYTAKYFEMFQLDSVDMSKGEANFSFGSRIFFKFNV